MACAGTLIYDAQYAAEWYFKLSRAYSNGTLPGTPPPFIVDPNDYNDGDTPGNAKYWSELGETSLAAYAAQASASATNAATSASHAMGYAAAALASQIDAASSASAAFGSSTIATNAKNAAEAYSLAAGVSATEADASADAAVVSAAAAVVSATASATSATASEGYMLSAEADSWAAEAARQEAEYWAGQSATSAATFTPHPEVPDKIVYVKTASQLSGTLDSTILYFLDGEIDMGTTSIVVPSGGLSLAGHGFGISGLVSTENNQTLFVTDGITYSGDLFLTSLDIRCSGVGSKVFDLDNLENFNACEWNTVNFLSCTSLGEIKNYRQGLGRNVAWISCKDGLTLTGAWSGGFAIVDSVVVGAPLTGVLFRAGAGLLIGGSFRANINILGLGTAGGYFCDFAPANFTLDAGFNLAGVRANKVVNNIPNMPASSTKALIRGCTGIGNTYPGGALRSTNEATITVSTVDTLYQMPNVGDFSEGYWFSKANTSGLQLDSTQDIQVDVGGSMSFSGSNNREIEVQLRKYVSATTSYVDIGPVYLATLNGGSTGTRAENVTFAATTGMSQNDRVEVWIKNVTDTTDITVLAAGQFQVFER